MTKEAASDDHRNIITLKGALSNGTKVSVSGNLQGIRMVQKLIGVDNFSLDINPTNNMVFFRYADRPGVVGAVGNAFAGINIGGMHIARDREGGQALMAITVDTSVDSKLLAEVASSIGADIARVVAL